MRNVQELDPRLRTFTPSEFWEAHVGTNASRETPFPHEDPTARMLGFAIHVLSGESVSTIPSICTEGYLTQPKYATLSPVPVVSGSFGDRFQMMITQGFIRFTTEHERLNPQWREPWLQISRKVAAQISPSGCSFVQERFDGDTFCYLPSKQVLWTRFDSTKQFRAFSVGARKLKALYLEGHSEDLVGREFMDSVQGLKLFDSRGQQLPSEEVDLIMRAAGESIVFGITWQTLFRLLYPTFSFINGFEKEREWYLRYWKEFQRLSPNLSITKQLHELGREVLSQTVKESHRRWKARDGKFPKTEEWRLLHLSLVNFV